MGLSRDDWSEAALAALAEEGLGGVAIDPLARRLGTTKGSFYWHFVNRDDLIAATLELWERRDTAEVIDAVERVGDPRERLLELARLAYGDAARGGDAEAGVLASATDPRVAPVLQRVTATRLSFLGRLYAGLGLDAAQARRRARLAYALYLGLRDLRRGAPDESPDAGEPQATIDLIMATLIPPARRGHGGPEPRQSSALTSTRRRSASTSPGAKRPAP